MYTLATIVCLASGLDVECKRTAELYPTRKECLQVGAAYVDYIKQSEPFYVYAACIKGGLV